MKKRAHTARATSARRATAPRIPRDPRPRRRGPAGANALALPAECTLAGAETLKMRLIALLKSVKPVTVDVRAVRRIDTASMQLLAAFVRDRRLAGLPATLSGQSAVFDEAVWLLGLSDLLGASSGLASQPASPRGSSLSGSSARDSSRAAPPSTGKPSSGAASPEMPASGA